MIRPFTLQLWELYYKSTPAGCLVPAYLTECECLVWREDDALISASYYPPSSAHTVGNWTTIKSDMSCTKIDQNMASKMSGGFLALQAKKSKEKKKVGDLEDAFKAADTDKDGKLTLDEWVDVLHRTGHSVTR